MVIPYIHTRDDGAELRVSLKTLPRIGDWSGKVFIVGDKERWFAELDWLTHLPALSTDNKFVNIQRALLAACDDPRVSERFYFSNDDVYINEDFFTIPPLYREPIDEQVADGDNFYLQSLHATKRLLMRQFHLDSAEIRNYETHTPLPVVKDRLALALRTIADIQRSGYMTLQLRTYYGNVERIGGEFYVDGKGKEGLAITSS